MSKKDFTVRLTAAVKRETYYPGNGRKKYGYKAKLGVLESSADTEQDARSRLQALAERAISVENATTVMFDVLEIGKVWIASGDAHGWHYEIHRQRERTQFSSWSTAQGGTPWTREECLDRMRFHWYDSNARHIVEGILALAGFGHGVCKRCDGVTRFQYRPTICENPACRAAL